jgi:FtsZ-binding cell division protein ZapB
MENIKKYIVDGDESEVFAISLVEEPAIESDFIALAKQKREVLLKDEKRHKVYGCVLRANFPIYRYSEQYGEYYLEFTADAIEKISKRFMKEMMQHQWTEDHRESIEGVYVTESWIKESEEFDKSKALGIGEDCAVGSWFIGAYIDSNDVWQKVEEGEFKGFSVEALVGINDDDIFSKQEAESTPVVETPTATETVAEPVVEQPSPNEPPPVPAEAVVEEPVQETVVETPTEPQEQPSEPQEQPTPEPEPNPLEDTIKSLQAEIDALKTKIADLTEENKELGKLPSADPVKPNAKQNRNDAWENWRKIAKQYV